MPSIPSLRRAASRLALFTCSLLLLAAVPASAIDLQDTRLLAEPAVSETHIAFVYAHDLWIARLDGTDVRRLTTHHGSERAPRFSPDGSMLAFSGEYDGNLDVYVVPIEGGVPRRLTWHPFADFVMDWTPDGSAVLFGSQRDDASRGRHVQLFTIPVGGGFPEALPIPSAWAATYSPDGDKLAYNPHLPAFQQWKNYRGGTASRIWLYQSSDHEVAQIRQPEGRSNDTDPMWLEGPSGPRVYFRSDRNGEFNLFSYDPASGEIVQLTHHEDFPVLAASGGHGRIVYEQGGYLHLYDLENESAHRLEIGVATDLVELRERWVEGSEWIQNASISPSGARAAFEFRGEIVTVPADKGDPRQITHSSGTNERSIAWSPDGATLAFFSDASGEYALHLAPQDGRGEARAIPIDGAGFYDTLKWSPDGEHLSFIDNSQSLYLVDLDDGALTKVHSEILYSPVRTLHHAWSPDSRWLAYTAITETYFQVVNLYSLDEKRSQAITEGLADVAEPVFDANGKYLYFLASTNAGPVRTWFAQSNADMEISRDLYLAVLPSGELSPLAKQNDEEKPKSEEEAEKKSDKKEGDTKEGDKKDDAVHVEIDFDGLHERIITVPIGTAAYHTLTPGAAGKLFYIASGAASGPFDQGAPGELKMYDFEAREETSLGDGVAWFEISADRKKMLALIGGDTWVVGEAGKKLDPGEQGLDTGAIRVRIDPRAEWEQIFHEAWRINRDYFYDPGMHGADWPALREKYAAFLPDLATRSDLNRVLRWMSSELSVGHHRVGGGDGLYEVEEIDVGLLGADYEIDQGRYRFKKVYGGLNWNPDERSPLTEPGVEVHAGEYLLAVDGRELRSGENLFSRFEHTVDRIVELEVGPSPDGEGSRTVRAVPIGSERALRNRDWVEGNLRRVDQATDGRVAYVYVPNTANGGHQYFKRYFYPQADREAIIVDERYNSGGLVADYYIDILRRPPISHWAMRYGRDLKTPLASIQGPKVMLIDENAGSGGDMLPWMFRKLGLGTLVGRPTWGGLVGILGFPPLLDGGYITAPNLAIWTEDGFIVENVGVPPDIEVEMLPKEVVEGRDPQLEKAIEVILEQLEANPPTEAKRPPYPIRVRR